MAIDVTLQVGDVGCGKCTFVERIDLPRDYPIRDWIVWIFNEGNLRVTVVTPKSSGLTEDGAKIVARQFRKSPCAVTIYDGIIPSMIQDINETGLEREKVDLNG